MRKLLAAVLVFGSLAYGVIACSSTPAVSAACAHAVNVQNKFSQQQYREGFNANNLNPDSDNYPNSQTAATLQIAMIEESLAKATVAAGCPNNIRYFNLLTGKWDGTVGP